MASKSNRSDEFVSKRQAVTVELQPDQLSAVDAWRERQDDKPNRADALVQLAAKALSSKGAH